MKSNPRERALKTLVEAEGALAKIKANISELEKMAKLVGKRKGDIIFTGIGKSSFIGKKIAATLTSLGERAYFIHPVEALHGDLGVLSDGDIIIALSYSGESQEVIKFIKYSKKNFDVLTMAFSKSKKTSLSMICDHSIPIVINEEGSPNNLAPMASTTAMLVLGDMLASMVSPDFKKDKFAKFHPGGNLGLELNDVAKIMKKGILLPTVPYTAGLEKILGEITKKKLGVTGVVDSRRNIIGVITDGDIRRFLLKDGNPKKGLAKEIMTKNPKIIKQTATLKAALEIMEKYKIMHLFVVNEMKRPVGIVHIHDIVGNYVV